MLMSMPNLIPQMLMVTVGRNKAHMVVMTPCELQIMVDMEKNTNTIQKTADRVSLRDMCLFRSAPTEQ